MEHWEEWSFGRVEDWEGWSIERGGALGGVEHWEAGALGGWSIGRGGALGGVEHWKEWSIGRGRVCTCVCEVGGEGEVVWGIKA